MKKIALTALALLLVLLLAACADTVEVPDGMQLVSTETADFNLFVPATWIPETPNGVSGAYVSTADRSNVTVTACVPETARTLDDYCSTVCLPAYAGSLVDFRVLDEQCGETTLGGRDARRFVFLYTLDATIYESMQIITAEGNCFYTLTYTSTSERYAAHLDDIERVRANFAFR